MSATLFMTQHRNSTSIKNKLKVIVPLLVLPWVLWICLGMGSGILSVVSLIYIAVFLYLCKDCRFQRIAKSWPLIIWISLTAYHLVNASLKQVPEIDFVDYLRGFKVYASICIFTFFFVVDFKSTLKQLILWLGIWLLIAFHFTDYTPGARLSGKIIAVQFGKIAAIMAICSIYLAAVRKYTIKHLLLMLLWPLLFISLSQTRNAFGMVVIQLLGYYYAFVMKGKMKIQWVFVSVLIAISLWISFGFVLENTGLGDRILSDIDSVEESKYREQFLTGTVFDYIAGERIEYYAIGWEIFNNYPITGIGLDNYQDFIKGKYPMHVEYMKHLAEGGIIAFILWIMFIVNLFRIVLNADDGKKWKFFRLFTLLTILFSCMYSVSYQNELSVILYSIILSAERKYRLNPKMRLKVVLFLRSRASKFGLDKNCHFYSNSTRRLE